MTHRVAANSNGLFPPCQGQGLYQSLKLNLPNDPLPTPQPILIYGGSTATGILGVQYAKLSGYRVITTASPRNFEYLKSLGADATIDYHSPTAVDEIKKAAGAPLKLAWDCHSDENSARISAAALSAEGGDAKYRSLLPVQDELIQSVNPGVNNAYTLAYTAFGEPFDKYIHFPAVPKDFEFATTFWALTEELFRDGKLKAARPIVNRGGKGLEGVLVGLQELKEGKVSGGKLVYTL